MICMNIKKIFGSIFIILFIIFTSFSCIASDLKEPLDENNNISNRFIERVMLNKNFNPNLLWFPGFLITLLLAPFIILYLIIAIILDIGNP